MKIIFLNTWNGRQQKELVDYLKQQIGDTDIFCFQEAYDEMKALCADTLAGYTGYFAYKFVTKDDDFPQAIYVKSSLEVQDSGTILENEPNCGLGQYIVVKTPAGLLNICNFHGMSRPADKLDNPQRLEQSRQLINHYSGNNRIIIGGDFNILPQAASIKTFSKHGYRDLITDFGITTTRNHLAWDRFPDHKEYYSDYVFISPGIEVLSLTVPNNEISDHLPLELIIKS